MKQPSTSRPLTTLYRKSALFVITLLSIFYFTSASPAVDRAPTRGNVQLTCTTNPVVVNSNDAGPGSLRQAIIDACPGSTITFDMNQVTSPINLTSGQLVIDKDLTIQGPGAALLDVHNANDFAGEVEVNWRVFNIGNVTVSISGIKISGGKVRGVGTNGAGINNTGQLTLTNCIVSGNQIGASFFIGYFGLGAGIYNNGTLTVNNSLIDNNTILNTSSENEPFSRAGGIHNSGTLFLNNSTVSNNNAETVGGIDNGGSMTILNSTISNNVSGVAGGINQSGSSLIINNSTISGNTAANGAGIYYNSGTCQITNCTITNNSGGYGAGIYNHLYSLSGVVPAGVFTIRNSILAGNTNPYINDFGDYYFPYDVSIPPAGYSNLTSLGNNIFGQVNAPHNWTFNGPNDQVGSTALPIDPKLGSLADNGGPTQTHALLSGSPAVNGGSNAAATGAGLTTDQRGAGFPRPAIVGTNVDIGAYEADNTTLALFAAPNTYTTLLNTSLVRTSTDTDDLLDNDNLNTSPTSLTSFGGGSLGGTVTSNEAGASVALAGGTLTVNSDGSFSLTNPTVKGAFTFQYRITNSSGTSDATVTINVDQLCPPAGTRWYVSAAAEPGGTGTSWACAFQDLQQALVAAGSGHEIWVAAGTYKPTATTNPEISFVMRDNVAIYGGFNGTEASLSQRNLVTNQSILSGDIGTPGDNADNTYHVIRNDNNNVGYTAILDGFTITAGKSGLTGGPYGGGMFNQGTNPTIRNCVFTGNAGANGGGVANVSASPRFINCIFRENTAIQYFNFEGYGFGAAVYNYVQSSPTFTNCTFYNNTAPNSGGGMYTDNFVASAFPTLTNCIVWGNNSGIVTKPYVNASITYSIIQDGCPANANCTSVSNVDPKFVSASNLRLQSDSPAINTGTNTGAPDYDIEGKIRPLTEANPADMGAYEDTTPTGPSAAVLGINGSAAICQGSTANLVVTITGGTSPYTLVYSDGTNSYTVDTYTSGTTIPVSPTVNTTYTLVSVTDAASLPGTGNSGTPTVTVNPVPNATINPSSATLTCTNTSVTLTAEGGVSYLWNTGAETAALIASVADTYSVTVTSDNGCTATASATVTAIPNPGAPTLSGASLTVMVSPDPLSLTGFVTADDGNTLSFFNSASVLLDPPTADISSPGVQTFSAVQTNAAGCSGPPTFFDLTVETTGITQPPLSQTVCRGSQVVLTVGVEGAASYQWFETGQSPKSRMNDKTNVQQGTSTSSLTLFSVQSTSNYFCRVTMPDGSVLWLGQYNVTVDKKCRNARLGAEESSPFSLTLLSNPIERGLLRAVVQGATGQPLQLEMYNLQGRLLGQQSHEQAREEHPVEWDLRGQPVGVYVLRAVSNGQVKQVKVLRQPD